jgi:hypothetical protein
VRGPAEPLECIEVVEGGRLLGGAFVIIGAGCDRTELVGDEEGGGTGDVRLLIELAVAAVATSSCFTTGEAR